MLWVETLERGGYKNSTIYDYRIGVDTVIHPDTMLPIGELTEARARRIWNRYEKRKTRTGKTATVATRQGDLGATKRFFKWCVDNQHIRTNPFEKIQVVGVVNKNKEQLTRREWQTLIDYCFANKSIESLAVVLIACYGLRANEVMQLTRRDLDGHTLLFARSAQKTERARRDGELWPELYDWVMASWQPDGRLFPDRDKSWPRNKVKKYCRWAGVPEVSAQALRGTFTSVGIEADIKLGDLQKMLGHRIGSTVTREHYMRPGLAEKKHQERVLTLVRND